LVVKLSATGPSSIRAYGLIEKARHVMHTLWTVNFQRKRPSNISFPIFHCIIPPDGARPGA